MSEMSWSRLYECRRKALGRLGKIWGLPLKKKYTDVIFEELEAGERVLDVGSYDRRLEARLQEAFPALVFKSMDVDRQRAHDYYSLEGIDEQFTTVFLFEVIEHLTLEEGARLLGRIYQLLEPGGKLLVTTPNIYLPAQFLRSATHVTPFAYDELAGLLLYLDFKVEKLYRIHNDALHRLVLKRYVLRPLFRLMGIDFAPQIMAVARK